MSRLPLLPIALAALAACGGSHRARQSGQNDHHAQIKHQELYDEIASTGHFTAGRPHSFRFHPDASRIYYLRPQDDGQLALFRFELATEEETLLLDTQSLLEGNAVRLSAKEKARRERLRQRSRGITHFSLSEDGNTLLIPLSGQVFLHREKSGTQRLQIKGHVIDVRLSPDASKVAYVRNKDLYVYDVSRKRERRIVKAGRNDIQCGLPEFVAQEEMRRYAGYWWSPDSRKIAYQCNDRTEVERLHVQDPASPERPASPLYYPRAGTPNVAVRFFIHDLARRRTSEFSLGEDSEYLVAVRWSADSRPLPVVQDRAQKRVWMLGCGASKDPRSTCPMEELRHDAWINLDPHLPMRHERTWLWSHDTHDGRAVRMRDTDRQMVRELLPASAGYRTSLGIHDGYFYFSGGPEPTESRIYRVALADPARVEELSTGHGIHRATAGPQGLWIDRASLADGTLKISIYRGTERVADLPYDPPKAPFLPRVEITTATERNLRAAIIRPRHFDQDLLYPVIVSVYGGPLTTVVHNAPRHYFLDQWIADQGFIVVKIDGRGTPHRTDAWEKATYRDLITLPMQDQIDALTALAARYPQLDRTRVGIQGWSFGGYFAAMAVMKHADVFRAAIAGAPVTDWRDYDTHYTERYMGRPKENPAGYEKTSLLTHASNLGGPLMLVHGVADDNVLYTHTAKLVDRLIRESKDFELVPLIGATHMGGAGATRRALQFRYVRFFKRTLGEPVPQKP